VIRLRPVKIIAAMASCWALVLAGVGVVPAAAVPASRTLRLAGLGDAAAGVGKARPGLLSVGQALALAAERHRPVVVSAATTVSGTLTANPGGSLTWQESAAPVRKLVAGQWVGLDATLRRTPGGGVVPAVTTGGLRFSGGGKGPLVTMTMGGRSLSLWFPGRFAAPVLSGATATYRSVLPGVDLVLTADAQGGFSEVLVVRDAVAARTPALRRLALAARATGVRLVAGRGGSVLALDPAGTAVFHAQRPLMWDSASPPRAARLVRGGIAGRLIDARSGLAAYSSAAGPGAGAQMARVGMDVVGGAVRLAPDLAMLRMRSTVFPVYIDPTFTPPSAGAQDSAWAQVDSAFPTTSYWRQSGWLQVGDQGWQSPYFVARSFVRFSTVSAAPIKGATILSAEMDFTEEYAPACSSNANEPTGVDLWHTGYISSGSPPTWNSQPLWDTRIDTAKVAYGYNSSCPPHGVQFSDPSFVSFWQGVANGSSVPPTETFGLRADESNIYGWKQFLNTANLSITYDHPADKPTGLTTNPSTACTASTPTTVGDGQVTLNIPVNDPDAGSSGSPQVGAQVKLWDTATGAEVSGFPTDPNSVYADWGQIAHAYAQQSALEAAANGSVTEFSWQAQATDFRKPSGSYVYSAPSATCNFYFDPTTQGAPVVTQQATAVMGHQVSFSVAPPATGSAPASYQYQLNDGPVQILSSSSGTITVTPNRSVSALTVTSVSSGGNIGATSTDTFSVAPGTNAAAADLSGDGKADLLTVGGANGLPAGLWLAAGSGTGQVGTHGDGTTGDNLPSDFAGDQAISGLFTGQAGSAAPSAGLQSVLAYNPSTGTGNILFGTGDGTAIPAQESGWEQDLLAVEDANGSIPQQLVNAGNASGLGEPYPDLLGTAGNALTLYSSAQLGNYVPDSLAANLDISTTPSPDGTVDWNSWTLAAAQLSSGTSAFLWNKSTGALYLWENLAYNGASGRLSYTQYVIADGSTATWNKGAALTLQAADLAGSGVPGLWTVGAGQVVTAYLATLGSGTATLAAQAAQTLNVPAHYWALADAASGTVTTAADSTGTLNATGSGNAVWNDSDPQISPDVLLDGTSGKLSTSSKVLNPGQNFTVSLWAKPEAIGGIVVSQDMTQAASFKLYTDGSTGEWAFCMARSDITNPVYDCAKGGTVYLGEWAHVTITYQASTATMTLYVNATTPVATASHAALTGVTNNGFQIGDRMQSPGSYVVYHNGEISGVQVWNAVVSP
jgi:archaellum component FlaF (FlaF/FlaG flagellin family)